MSTLAGIKYHALTSRIDPTPSHKLHNSFIERFVGLCRNYADVAKIEELVRKTIEHNKAVREIVGPHAKQFEVEPYDRNLEHIQQAHMSHFADRVLLFPSYHKEMQDGDKLCEELRVDDFRDLHLGWTSAIATEKLSLPTPALPGSTSSSSAADGRQQAHLANTMASSTEPSAVSSTLDSAACPAPTETKRTDTSDQQSDVGRHLGHSTE